ncbi:MAG: HDOD domain-containing protein [Pseudomonadota bacterium]
MTGLTHAPSLEKELSIISDAPSTEKNTPLSTKDRLLEAINNDSDLPALGSSISRIVQLSSSGDESIRQLAYFVLSDVSLTQKILRLSNSVTFRATSNTKVITSITKAIFLLGFNTVKTCALAMLLVDLMSGKQAEYVRTELIQALAASMIGRELARHSHFPDAEEIAVAALFKNIGRLLLAAYDDEKYQEMMTLIGKSAHTPGQASMEVLNFSLDKFSETILEQWDIPVSIINALKNRPPGSLNSPKNKQEWMQQAAELSEKATPLILGIGKAESAELENKLITRFGKSLNLDKPKLDQLILDATEETKALQANVNALSDKNKGNDTDKTKTELAPHINEDVLEDLIFGNTDTENVQITQRHPSGKPFNAPALLLAGVQDVSEIMASSHYKLNDLIMLILETYYNSLGFRFITLCLRDAQKNQYRARSSLGKNNEAYQKAFFFSALLSNDLFHLAMGRNVDLLISDATVPKVRELLPPWHQKLLPDARSFIVLPLVLNKNPVGFFYADRELEAPEGTTSEEMRLIKTLKGQVLTALNSK